MARSNACRSRSAFRSGSNPRSLSRWRFQPQVETLESRVTPSLTTVFELDANVDTTTSHDWDQIFADSQTDPTGTTSGALALSFVTDAVNSNQDDIFTGGGSKDTQGIQDGSWLFTGSKPQGKNDITHAYAAAYTDPSNGHLLLYVGLDRYDNSGDATVGFWFFRNQIGLDADVTRNGGHPFVGEHADGDILLVSDFTQGGSTSTIKVYQWVGDDSTGGLVAVPDVPNTTFAIVNNAAITVPWSYTNKSGGSQPAAGEFFEGGIDLTALGLTGCFSTFLAETRSSQSPTATLSDFVLGSFPLCSIEATPFTGLSKVGDGVVYELKVQNTGADTVYVQDITDDLLGNIILNGVVQAPVGPVTSIDASALGDGALDPGETLTIFVTRTVQSGDDDHTISTTTFVCNDAADFSSDEITDSATNDVNLFQPSATLTVTATPDTADQLGDPIVYTFTVTNTSSADSPNLVLSLSNPNNSFTDTLLGNLEDEAIAAEGDGSVAPGGSFSFTVTRAIQAGDPAPLVNTATVVFTLAQNLGAFDNQISAADSATVTLLPHLVIEKTVNGQDVIHPGDTASFTITVTNDGAGPATNVVVTDELPEADLLTWSVFSSSNFDTATLNSADVLTAAQNSLAAGASATVTVNAVIPLDIFGAPPSGGTGNLPSGPFELDGNVATATTHDWDQVFDDVVNGTSTSGAFAASFVTDAVNSRSDDIFTGGGSKDTLGIQQGAWLFTDSKPQAKDDIMHAYAAMYTDPSNGHVILYAGLDRYDNSGAATAGFWFFTNPVGQNPNVTTNGGHPFTGTHADGDILLVSDFTVGGSVSTIKVFRWTGNDSTGSLVPITAPAGTTFAIVNSGSIDVPWSFTDKSRRSDPAAGEFLEEGVDLTALGLGGCFSNFMAETRSSQSPTATLSDFVIGSFNTCRIDLPNTASVSATGLATLTSDEVVITILDGDEMLQAESIGSSVVTEGLSLQQLQAIVTQAINDWGAAGIDPQALSVLEHITVHVGNLPRAELGLALPGEIWIDRTAAGWGWSTNGDAGKMDLATVIRHELGHVLGFEHGDAGVMEARLAPGVRLLAEAPASAFVVAPPATGPAVFSSSAQFIQPVVSLSPALRSEASAATFVSTPRDGFTLLPVGGADANALLNRQVGVPAGFGPPALLLAPTAIATVRVESAQGSSNILFPALRPWDDNGPDAVTRDSVPAVRPGTDDQGATPVDPEAWDEASASSGPWALDACFADGSWKVETTEDSGLIPASAAAALTALLVLGGHWAAPEAEPHKRRRLSIDGL